MKRLSFWILVLLNFSLAAQPWLVFQDWTPRGLSYEENQALMHALEFEFSRRGFQIALSEEQAQGKPDTSFWKLKSYVEGIDTLLEISLELASPEGTSRKAVLALPRSLSALQIAETSLNVLFDSTFAPEHTPLSLNPSYPGWIAPLAWVGFGAWAWSQGSFNGTSSSETSVSLMGSGHAGSGYSGFFAGNIPHPVIRGTAGAGSALPGVGRQTLNPAAAAYGHEQLDFAASKLPGGTAEAYGDWVIPGPRGVWQVHSLRYEGDSLAQAYRLSSTWALDLGYWFPWLENVHTGLSLKATTVSLGSSTSTSDVTGSGVGGGLDLGVQWRLVQNVSMGISWIDAVAMERYTNDLTSRSYLERDPSRWIFGMAWAAPQGIALMVDCQGSAYAELPWILSLGMEKDLFGVASWRAGHRIGRDESESSWNMGWSANVRAGDYRFHLDYALEAQGNTGLYNVLQTAGIRLDLGR